MMKQAQDMAKSFNPSLESFSPKGFENLWPTMPKEAMEMMFGNALNKDGLDAKTRLLLTLAGLTCQGAQADAAIRQKAAQADLAELNLARQLGELVDRGAVEAAFVEAAARMNDAAKGAITSEADKLLAELHLPAENMLVVRASFETLRREMLERFANVFAAAAAQFNAAAPEAVADVAARLKTLAELSDRLRLGPRASARGRARAA